MDLVKISIGGTIDNSVEPIIDTLYALLLEYSSLLTRKKGLEVSINELIMPDRVAKTQFLL